MTLRPVALVVTDVLEPRLEGVHVSDGRPLAALAASVVGQPPLAVMVPPERLRIRTPHRVKRTGRPW